MHAQLFRFAVVPATTAAVVVAFRPKILTGIYIFLERDLNTVKSRENYESIKNTFIFHLPPTGNRRTKFERIHEKKNENHFCGNP